MGDRNIPVKTRRSMSCTVNEEAAIRFGWLVQAGCEMPASSLERWQEIKREIPGWQDAWAESAARTPEGRAGWVGYQ